jgi:4-alpha-glucanotransferase
MINRDELPDESGYRQFCEDNKDWLTGYVAFTVLKEINGGKAWYEWPDEHKFGDPEKMIEELSAEYGDRIEELAKDQYYFCVQWNDLREYAHGLGIEMMGDLPMYMASDSADVWAAKGEFGLDEDGRKKVHSGVPPDAFSKDGQDWGNPLYNWDVMKAEGYSWWMRRLKQCAERFDILRIDHFRGFSEYYAIPEGATPKEGSWQHSAGLEFFRAVKKMLDEEGLGMKLLAEDLGFLDDGVLSLLKLTGLPGMDIWQFTADEMLAMEPEKAAHRAFYTGTHDNNTLMGFLLGDDENPDAASDDNGRMPDDDEEHYDGALMTGGQTAADKKRTAAEAEAKDIIRQIYESPAALAMLQLQDMFMLGSETRINVPGIAEGNWSWRTPADSVEESFSGAAERAAWFRELAEKTGRI